MTDYYQEKQTSQIIDEYQIRVAHPNTSFSFPLSSDVCESFELEYLPDYQPPVYIPSEQEKAKIRILAIDQELVRIDASIQRSLRDIVLSLSMVKPVDNFALSKVKQAEEQAALLRVERSTLNAS